MEDRREFERKVTSVRVEMEHPSCGYLAGFARDISDGGASVLVNSSQLPPVGTLLNVRFSRLIGRINEDSVPMKVVNLRRNVMGLMFVPETSMVSGQS
ncbi:PilZ domain-containing protein [Candidatus Pelagadaptatus aseana]|uniref:PilZ domain-containing protein n=1 Tax=Candidatus Pelagadaptatus aseana TaxID=3120508 RepID=UPI003C7026EF